MSRIKIMDASELRAEAARYQITISEIAQALGLTQNYVWLIFHGRRNAPRRRKQIQDYILSKVNEELEMTGKKRMVILYTRIDGVERTQVAPELQKPGFTKDLEFHKSLGLSDESNTPKGA